MAFSFKALPFMHRLSAAWEELQLAVTHASIYAYATM